MPEKSNIATVYELLQQLQIPLSPQNTKIMAVIYGKLEEAYEEEKKRADQPAEAPEERPAE